MKRKTCFSPEDQRIIFDQTETEKEDSVESASAMCLLTKRIFLDSMQFDR